MKKIIYNKYVILFLNHTWGIIMTLIGYMVRLVLLSMGVKGRKEGFARLYKVGKGWGGVSLGTTIIVACDCDDKDIVGHEQGHGIQNAFFGVLFPFLIAIPSAIRYWYREIVRRRDRVAYALLPQYDSIWFEGQATLIGMIYRNFYQGE